MARAGKPLEAYRAFPGGKESFGILAEQLVASGHTSALRELIDEHGVFFDDDPYLNVYRGQVAFEHKKYAEADEAWTAAFKTLRDGYMHGQFQRRWVRARHGAGKSLEALQDIPPLQETFGVLADLCLEHRQHEQLEKLIAAYHQRTMYGKSVATPYLLRMNPDADVAALLKIGQTAGDMPSVYYHLADRGKSLEAYKASADGKEAFKTLSSSLLYHGKYSEVRKLIEAHRKASPADLETDVVEGKLLLESRQLDKAIEFLKKPATDGGKYSAAKRAYVEACYSAGKGLKAYEEFGFDEGVFISLAIYYTSDRDPTGLDALLKARPDGKGFEAWKHDFTVKALSGKPDEALALFLAHRKAATVVKKGKKKFGGFSDSTFEKSRAMRDDADFAFQMAQIGKGLEAYRIAAYPEDLFRNLARQFRSLKVADNLAMLVKEHAAKYPNDPELPLNVGFIEMIRGHHELAEQMFRAELAKASPAKAVRVLGDLDAVFREVNQTALRDGLTRVLVRQGRTVEAYRADGADPEAFYRFARYCIEEKAGAELEALAIAHRKKFPADPNLRRCEGEVLFLKGDYQAAWKILKDGPAMYLHGQKSDSLNGDDERTKAVVCLVRLKRHAEAIRLAESLEINGRYGNPTPVVLAHAADGDVKRTLQLIEVNTRHPNRLADFYRDEDLGPLLRSDAMRKVRDRFPDPAKN